MTLVCPPIASIESLAANTAVAGVGAASAVSSLLENCNAIPAHVPIAQTEMELRALENGWCTHLSESGVRFQDFTPPATTIEIISDRADEPIPPHQARRFALLGALADYLNGNEFADMLINGAFSALHPPFAMTVFASHLLSLTGDHKNISAVITAHKGLQLLASDISWLLYSAPITHPEGYDAPTTILSPLRLWEELMEISDQQIVPLDNRLLIAQTLYHLSLGESFEQDDSLYAGRPLAFSFVDAALSIYPKHAPALYQRGKIEDSDIETALDRLRRALALAPNHFEAWETVGNVYEVAGMPSEARDCWEYALQLMEQKAKVEERTGINTGIIPSDQQRAPWQFKLGVLCEAMGDSDRARTHYRKANELSNGAINMPLLILASSKAQYDPAEVFLRMAQIFQREGYAGEAEPRLQKALELDPELVRSLR